MPIRLENLYFSYNAYSKYARQALDDINLEFQDNSFTCLIGKTGSGKSTLIQQLNALLIPTSGKVSVDDYIVDMSLEYKHKKDPNLKIVSERKMKKKHKKKLKNIKDLRKKVGLVFQFPEYQIFEETVLKDVSYGPKNFGVSAEEAIKVSKEALSLVGIDSSYYERSPFELSGGEKRRIAIAGILALKPSILVLDEPTVGLDKGGEENLLNLLTTIKNSGVSIIVATHDMDVVLKYADRAIVLDKGKVIHDSTPLELFQNENFLVNSSLQPPKVFSFAQKLIANGVNVDLTKIKDSQSLASEIARIKGEKK